MERWALLVNTGGLGLFAWVVYHQLAGMRRELRETIDKFTKTAQDNGRLLAVLHDRVHRKDETT